jgi:glucose-6-phosphate 1-dehydrogenase
MRPLKSADVVRGQYAGYRREKDVARDSDVETYCAVRLFIDSWRWEGVPWYLRSGKLLAGTVAEVFVQLKPPPQRLFADSAQAAGRTNYLRFRLSPNSAVALAARVKRMGKEFIGDQRELYLVDHHPGAETPYERLLSDAMVGDGALFTREDAVEAAWRVVDHVLKTNRSVRLYPRGSWGPKEADALIAKDGGWHDPLVEGREGSAWDARRTDPRGPEDSTPVGVALTGETAPERARPLTWSRATMFVSGRLLRSTRSSSSSFPSSRPAACRTSPGCGSRRP